MEIRRILSPITIVFVFAFISRFVGLANLPFRVDGDSSRFAIDGLLAWENNWKFFV